MSTRSFWRGFLDGLCQAFFPRFDPPSPPKPLKHLKKIRMLTPGEDIALAWMEVGDALRTVIKEKKP